MLANNIIMSALEFIKECQEKVFSGIGVSADDAKRLLNTPEENLKELARCANEITRDFNGKKVDVEQLNNIKKNACSEDCTFCGQSAFFDTGIETYQLPSPEEVVIKAQKAKEEGAMSSVELTVNTPYHSKYLINYSESFKRYINTIQICDAEIPIISTYDQREIVKVSEIKSELLFNLTSKINWYKTMQQLLTKDVSNIYECGAGKDLKKISRFIKGLVVSDLNDSLNVSGIVIIISVEFTIYLFLDI